MHYYSLANSVLLLNYQVVLLPDSETKSGEAKVLFEGKKL
jgi:hypothetical protein